MAAIKLVRNDTRPDLVVTLTDPDSGDPINITDATLVMFFRQVGSTETAAEIAGIVLDGAAGLCKFVWGADSLSGPAGLYEGEIQITFSDTTVQTVYEKLRFRLREEM